MPAVIPSLALIVGLFFAIIGYMTARGLLATWTHTLGYLLQALAGALAFSIPLGFRSKRIDLGGPVRALDHAIVTAIQNWADGAEIEMGYCLHGLGLLAEAIGQAIDTLAHETSETIDALVRVHLPKRLKLLAVPGSLALYIARAVADAIHHAIPAVRKEIHVVTHDIPRVTVKVIRQAAAGAATIPGWVIHIPRELRGLETQAGRLSKRIGRVEALVGATAMAAVLANVLGVSARCIRRGNLGRAARSICGLDPSLLEDLLVGGLAIIGTVSVVEFAEGLRAIEDETLKLASGLVKEWPS